MEDTGRIRRWIGSMLIVMSVIIVIGAVFLGHCARTGIRSRGLRLFQESFSSGAVLARDFAPCCDTLSAQTIPELCRNVHELRGAMRSLGPVSEFTVAAAEFDVLGVKPFGAYRSAADDFCKAVPVMQNAAASMERELHRMQKLFPDGTGTRLRRIQTVFEEASAMSELGISHDDVISGGILLIGFLLAIPIFFNGYFLCGGLSVSERKGFRD